MQSTHTYIIDTLHIHSKVFRCLCRLLGNGDISCTGCADDNTAAQFLVCRYNLEQPRHRIILHIREYFTEPFVLILCCPRTKCLTTIQNQMFEYLDQLLIRFSAAKNDLRETGARVPVCIQFCAAKFFKRRTPKIRLCICNRKLVVLYLLKDFSYVHHANISFILPVR